MTSAYEYIIFGYVLVLGLVFGSFATALSWRVPRGIPWIVNLKTKDRCDIACRSRCSYCHTKLGILDLIPVFSWLFSGGKCRHCAVPFGVRYPLIEILCLAACFVAYGFWGLSPTLVPVFLAIPFLLALIVIDMDYFLLPNQLVIILGVLGVVFVGCHTYDQSGFSPDAFIGGYLWGVISFFAYGVFSAFLGWVMSLLLKKDALGGGDVKFFAVAGLWLGLEYLPFFLIGSGCIGVMWAVFYRSLKGGQVFPFGPALIITFFVALMLKSIALIPFA